MKFLYGSLTLTVHVHGLFNALLAPLYDGSTVIPHFRFKIFFYYCFYYMFELSIVFSF